MRLNDKPKEIKLGSFGFYSLWKHNTMTTLIWSQEGDKEGDKPNSSKFWSSWKHNMRMKEENLEKEYKLKDKEILQLLKTQQSKKTKI